MKNVIKIDNPSLEATEKYKKHLSVVKITEKAKIQNLFCFKHVASIEIKRILKDMHLQSHSKR